MKMKIKMMVMVIASAACCLVFLSLFSFSSAAGEQPHAPVIVVVKSRDVPQYNQAMDGFLEYLAEKKVFAALHIYMYKDKDIIDEIKSQNPALILTLGTPAARFVSQHITGIPIVFSLILDPWGVSIASKNIVGASLDIPVKLQMENLHLVLPKLKRIGVIYNPSENKQIITEAKQAAADLGYILKAYPVSSTREIPKLSELNIDVLWMIPDNTVCQTAILKRLILCSVKEKIPVMGYNRSWAATSGALLALSCDYKDVGRQTGDIALRILNGENYSDITISRPRKVKLYLNQIVAELLGIKFPKKIIKKADEVFK